MITRDALKDIVVLAQACLDMRNRADIYESKNPGSAMQSEYWAPNIYECDSELLRRMRELLNA